MKLKQPELALKLDERGEVVMLHGSQRIVLGAKDAVREELCRFLAELDHGDDCAPALEAEQG